MDTRSSRMRACGDRCNGVPIAIKDIFDVAGLPPAVALAPSRMLNPPGKDSTAVRGCGRRVRCWRERPTRTSWRWETTRHRVATRGTWS